jgi:hypothetical protein
MSSFRKTIFIFISFISGAMQAMNNDGILYVKDSAIRYPHKLGKINLFHNENGFNLTHNNQTHQIKKYWTDPALRVMTKPQLEKFQDNGYIAINQLDNDEFTLKAHVRGLGGGPATGYAAWIATQAIGWVAFGVAVVVTKGEAVVHVHEIKDAITTAAETARFVGNALPTP